MALSSESEVVQVLRYSVNESAENRMRSQRTMSHIRALLKCRFLNAPTMRRKSNRRTDSTNRIGIAIGSHGMFAKIKECGL